MFSDSNFQSASQTHFKVNSTHSALASRRARVVLLYVVIIVCGAPGGMIKLHVHTSNLFHPPKVVALQPSARARIKPFTVSYHHRKTKPTRSVSRGDRIAWGWFPTDRPFFLHRTFDAPGRIQGTPYQVSSRFKI